MRVKTFVTVSTFLISSSCTALLSGCSSSNPLKTADPEVAAHFLVKASQAAEKKLNLSRATSGSYYGRCMREEEKKALCDRLYQAMVTYAKTTTTFKGLTVKNLTDPHAFEKVKEDYLREWFNTV